MIRLSKSVLAVGGVILAGGLITVMNPKTVHAVAAALVQVTNTASNPAVVQGIGKQAAQIVEISCGAVFPADAEGFGCYVVPPLGGTADVDTLYAVPNGQSLVVDSADVYTGITGNNSGTPCMSSALVQLFLKVDGFVGVRYEWLMPAGAGTSHYVYPSGIVVPAGTVLSSVAAQSSTCTAGVELHGYLTTQ